MFFCKDIFGDIPKALSVKGMKALLNKSNFLETGTLPYFEMCLFHFWLGVSPDASRLTIPSPCLVPARPG